MNLSKQDEFDVNLGINAFYSHEYAAGLRATERLLHKPLGWKVENNTRCNQTYYLSKLSDHSDTTIIKIKVPFLSDKFSSFNPTVIRYQEKYLVLVRHSNYVIVNGKYVIDDPNRVITTKYSAIIYDDSLMIQEIRFLNNESYEKSHFPADGIEDIRLYYNGEQLMGTGTIRNMTPYFDKAKIAKVKIDIQNNSISVPQILTSPWPGERHEKNWMPILGAEPRWLYCCGENNTSITITEHDKITSIVTERPAPEIAKHFRGGSQVVRIEDDLYLCITHEVCIFSNGIRNYIHRFILLDSSFTIVDYSLPFFLSNSCTIEFVAGLCINNGDLLITYGHMDKEAFILKLPVKNVISMINNRKEFMNENRRVCYF